MSQKERKFEPVYTFPIPRIIVGMMGNTISIGGVFFESYKLNLFQNPFLATIPLSISLYLGARFRENALNLHTVATAMKYHLSSDQENVSLTRKVLWPARYRAF